ncbi:hypothetical protein [Legionella bononiensis]|uniref:C-type lysozyme inhibitor domain-containing protein n=1 Tax=Legionella bononiensis TaxID=2793102 RepID=A0ABS1WBR7_9GAMM|nr:hypothetical protein [Legionella bononiensis]MBL7481084.1 hypothetical protein [Legionella bononiensis]MBL7526793.1 hypothetical protein [Legionella bononiensis]MBL7564200.1 hypothetical protein [Legionella bononiensis]
MKQFILCILITFGTALSHASSNTVECTMEEMNDTISFVIPETMAKVPSVDFDYPIKVIQFSMRSGNLLLVAVDQEDSSRPRLFISAQLNKKNKTYIGQFMTDSGGNEIQLDNGVVTCKVNGTDH